MSGGAVPRIMPEAQMTRPICTFPKVPRYSGAGDTNDAGSFVCATDNNSNNPVPAPEYLQ